MGNSMSCRQYKDSTNYVTSHWGENGHNGNGTGTKVFYRFQFMLLIIKSPLSQPPLQYQPRHPQVGLSGALCCVQASRFVAFVNTGST